MDINRLVEGTVGLLLQPGFTAEDFQQIRTNKGRELSYSSGFGDDDREWIPISTPPGRTIVGLIVSFAHGCGGSKGGLRVRDPGDPKR